MPLLRKRGKRRRELTELQAEPGTRRFICPTCQHDFEFDLKRH